MAKCTLQVLERELDLRAVRLWIDGTGSAEFTPHTAGRGLHPLSSLCPATCFHLSASASSDAHLLAE